ncbi:MAG TPA: ATP-binding protein [Candidatus Saccharimonadales bacterium]|jgi:PAS domain S-box-containing protein|nr:ATP-binding protein [Candidatus Saccharimonadales bacterium]
MIVDDFMFHVSKVWYRIYWGTMVALNGAIVTLNLLAHKIPALHNIAQQYYLNSDVTLTLAGATLIYLVGLYWLVARFGIALATLGGTMLNSLVLLNGISNAQGSAKYVFIGIWIFTTALNGIYGIPIVLGSALVSSIVVFLASSFHPVNITRPLWVLLGGAVAAAGLGYLFWRNRFTSQQARQVDKLSGMLRSNQEQSAILIQSIDDGVIVINTEGKITLINPAAASMTQWPVTEATGIEAQLVVKLSSEKGEEIAGDQNPFAEVLTKKRRISQNLQLNGRDGKKIIISLVISPISVGESNTDSHIAGAVAVMRDVSAERAEEQQRAEFISTASHEMRTPVAAIEGYLALALNEKVSSIDSRARGFLEKAHSSTQHLGQLFQDLLTSAKAEDGRLSNHPSVIEMGSYLQQLVEDLRFSAQKKGLAAEFVVGTGESIDATNPNAIDTTSALKVVKPLYYAYADPDRLREVITNIFDNACKYTEAGKVSIGLTGNNDVVQLYVRDTGAGIPAEDIPHLFQKFYRVDNSATRTIGGTGLGLFISRKIIELYQGRVWVESQLGKGSTFFINLPRLSAQRASQLQSQQAADEAKETAAPITAETTKTPNAPTTLAAAAPTEQAKS